MMALNFIYGVKYLLIAERFNLQDTEALRKQMPWCISVHTQGD